MDDATQVNSCACIPLRRTLLFLSRLRKSSSSSDYQIALHSFHCPVTRFSTFIRLPSEAGVVSNTQAGTNLGEEEVVSGGLGGIWETHLMKGKLGCPPLEIFVNIKFWKT